MATSMNCRARRGTGYQTIKRALYGAQVRAYRNTLQQRTMMHNKGVSTTMTTEVTMTPANKVIVVGMLDTMLVRERGARPGAEGRAKMVAVTRREGRSRGRGGRWENLMLQVRSPYGGMFAMPIEIEPN